MSTSAPASKNDLRAAALARRVAMSTAARAAAAETVAARAFPVEIRSGAVVSGYWPIKCEIDPIPLMRRLAGASGRASRSS